MENAPLIDQAPALDDSEASTRADRVGVEITSTSVASDIDPPLVTSTNFETSASSHSHSDEGSISLDRSSFNFGRFLEGGALDDIFGSISTTTSNFAPSGAKWKVVRLSGGVINVTLRVILLRGDDEPERNPRSVIVKYAPPYMAEIGKDVPFGTFRQVIEYRALSLLNSTPSLATAMAAYRVSIPKVLKFLKDEKVLVLQDLGEWMKPLESWMYPSTASTMESPPSLELCASVGTRLGGLLASIHCDATLLSKSQTLTDDGKPWFENPEANDLVRCNIVGKILPTLQANLDPRRGGKEKIAEIISEDFEQSFLDVLHSSSSPSAGVTKSMFSAGDLWTGSFIVGASPAYDSNLDPNSDANRPVELGFIDWEFASPARTGQDIAQLSAWLYLYSTSSTWSHRHRIATDTIDSTSSAGLCESTSDSGAGTSQCSSKEGGLCSVAGDGLELQSPVGSLRCALLRAYAQKVKDYPSYAWLVDDDLDQCRFEKERLAVIRSIWIFFGREIIYYSIDMKLNFTEFFSAGADGDEEMKVWQREVIETGCWYVSMAGQESDEEFEEIVRKECVLRGIYTMSQ